MLPTDFITGLPLNWDPLFEMIDRILDNPMGDPAYNRRADWVKINRYTPMDYVLSWAVNISNDLHPIYKVSNVISEKCCQYGDGWIVVMETYDPVDPDERSVTVALYRYDEKPNLYILAEFPLYVIHEEYFDDATFINYGA